jgi:hypothetical protein
LVGKGVGVDWTYIYRETILASASSMCSRCTSSARTLDSRSRSSSAAFRSASNSERAPSSSTCSPPILSLGGGGSAAVATASSDGARGHTLDQRTPLQCDPSSGLPSQPHAAAASAHAGTLARTGTRSNTERTLRHALEYAAYHLPGDCRNVNNCMSRREGVFRCHIRGWRATAVRLPPCP